tara:strand:+ start:632 stop:1516 length:885 start_codon:yes stop_codon:yes gene_type:complete
MYDIGKNSKIIANNIDIADSVIIGDNVFIECDTVKIGEFSKIGNDVKVTCKTFEVGSWLFMWDRVEVGRGGCYGPNSTLKIGNHVGIFEGTIINPSEPVEIGNDVGIGGEVMIWTHGAWLDVLKGFPAEFGPVKIGNDVWLPARSVVLPNVTIGSDVVIGINSIINRSLPAGCFAAGSPCKVIKENCYPKELNKDEKKNIVNNILEDWKKLYKYKGGLDCSLTYDSDNECIKLTQYDYSWPNGEKTIFNLKDRTISGYEDNISEDLRDYLRRCGIKIYTNKHFKSMNIPYRETL